MIVLFEILFALWLIQAFASVFIGLTQILLGLAAQVAAWVLLLLSQCVEIFLRLWRTAFYNVEN